MSPARLYGLVTRAVGHKPTELDLEAWRDSLACPPHLTCDPAGCVHDTEADRALVEHRKASTYPPTPADIRRIAIGYANVRVEQQEQAERDSAREQRVPPTPDWLEERRKLDEAFAARQREMLPELPDPTDPAEQARRAAVRAAADAELTQGASS